MEALPWKDMVRTMPAHVHHPWGTVVSLALFFAACFALAGTAQEPGNPSQTATPPAYDVVSIKPHKPELNLSSGWRIAADGFSATQIKTQMLIVLAYGLNTPEQIVSLPSWASSDGLDIKARVDEETAASWRKLPDAEVQRRQLPMMQSLLSDRFQLKVHHETRQLPILKLVLAKSGPKIKDSPANSSSASAMSNGYIMGHATSMQTFAFNLSNQIGQQVVDETGLTGNYDFVLKWTPDDQQGTPDAGPTLFTALQEQLGLKLVPARGPVEVIVIDRIERPSAN